MMSKIEARQQLIEAGAEHCKKEDQHGDTRSGWWMDDIYLGKDEKLALEALRG
jgi:hypothetical protein